MGVVSGFGADRGGEQQQVSMTSSTYVNSTGHRLSFGIGGVSDLNPKEQLVPALERTVRYPRRPAGSKSARGSARAPVSFCRPFLLGEHHDSRSCLRAPLTRPYIVRVDVRRPDRVTFPYDSLIDHAR